MKRPPDSNQACIVPSASQGGGRDTVPEAFKERVDLVLRDVTSRRSADGSVVGQGDLSGLSQTERLIPGAAGTQVSPTAPDRNWRGTCSCAGSLAEASWAVLLIRAAGSCHAKAAAGEMASGGAGGNGTLPQPSLLLLSRLACQGTGQAQQWANWESPSSPASLCHETAVWSCVWKIPPDKRIWNSHCLKLTFSFCL